MTVKNNGFKWPERFGTVAWTGLGVTLLNSWMPILSEKTGMKTQVMATPDSVCRFRWLRYGLVDMTAGGTTELSHGVTPISRPPTISSPASKRLT
jgi:hypothetical protein